MMCRGVSRGSCGVALKQLLLAYCKLCDMQEVLFEGEFMKKTIIKAVGCVTTVLVLSVVLWFLFDHLKSEDIKIEPISTDQANSAIIRICILIVS